MLNRDIFVCVISKIALNYSCRQNNLKIFMYQTYHEMFPFCPDSGDKIWTQHTLVIQHELHVQLLSEAAPPSPSPGTVCFLASFNKDWSQTFVTICTICNQTKRLPQWAQWVSSSWGISSWDQPLPALQCSLPIRSEMPGKIKQGDVPQALASDGKGCWAMGQLIGNFSVRFRLVFE